MQGPEEAGGKVTGVRIETTYKAGHWDESANGDEVHGQGER